MLRERRWASIAGIVLCLALGITFGGLDARHPRASLKCTRHAVRPVGVSEEDIDCVLRVRLSSESNSRKIMLWGGGAEEVYSFELADAVVKSTTTHRDGVNLVGCRVTCSPRGCYCDPSAIWGSEHEEVEVKETASVITSEQAGVPPPTSEPISKYKSLLLTHTVVLLDNEGRQYPYYTFKDGALATDTLEKVQTFVARARQASAGGDTLLLEVAFDDSWLDELACIVFLVSSVLLMARPMTEWVVFDAGAGVMEVTRRNSFCISTFRFSCALENVSRVEVGEAEVMLLRAAAAGQARFSRRREFGIRVALTLPSSPSMDSSNSAPPSAGHPVSAGPMSVVFLNLAMGKLRDRDQELRQIAGLVNEMLASYAVESTEEVNAEKLARTCCVCQRRPALIFFIPCKHLCMCAKCSESVAMCPLCRAEIQERHQVFL